MRVADVKRVLWDDIVYYGMILFIMDGIVCEVE